MRSAISRLRGSSRAAAEPSPPVPAPAAEVLDGAPDGRDFITGNGYAAACGWARNHGVPRRHPDGRAGWFFCKTDHLEWFFAREAPRRPYVLLTHNSDFPIDERWMPQLRRRALRAWFAVNVELHHPKLHPLPLGIANPHWPHGDVEALRTVQGQPPPKSELFEASYSLETAPRARRHCVEQTGLEPVAPRPFPEYLRALAGAYFSICPRGHGIDTHRLWESLYVGTIPVVTRSRLTDVHPDLPLVVLGDWSEFRSIDFSPQLHARVWGDWSCDAIRLDRYLERLDAVAR